MAKNDYQQYRKGSWIVLGSLLSDKSRVYRVLNVNECNDPIEAINLESAMKIADCLAENAA